MPTSNDKLRMVNLENPVLGQVIYLLNFKEPQEKIRFTQGDAEVAFGAFGAGQSQQTNVQDNADPSFPRLIFVNEHKSIQISQVAVQYHQGLLSDSRDIRTQIESIKTDITAFHTQAMEYMRGDVALYGSIGVVATLNYASSESIDFLNQYLYGKFISFKSSSPLASFQLTLGFKHGDFFVNLGASVFETRQIDLNGMPQVLPLSPLAVMSTVQRAKVLSKGIQFTIDINDRPRFSKDLEAVVEDPKELFSMLDDYVFVQLPSIVGERRHATS